MPTPDATEYTIVAERGLPSDSPAQRRYRGALAASVDASRPGTLRLIHTVELERYVAGVVQREYGKTDLEGSKAMAVLARTYALRQRGRVADYDLVDTIEHQVYWGIEGIRSYALQATEQTRGELLMYQGRLADAVYSASSGGYTAANHDVWNSTPVTYLRAQPDPYDARLSPHRSWTSRLDAAPFLAALSQSYGPNVTGFRVSARTDDGRAQQVRLTLRGGESRTITATQFRRVANRLGGSMTLRSFMFDATLDGNKAVFTGSGFGHGVGLSQWGARAQALDGRSYRQILGYYFPGTTLLMPDGTAVPVPTAPMLEALLATSQPPAPQADSETPRPSASVPAPTGQPNRNTTSSIALPRPISPEPTTMAPPQRPAPRSAPPSNAPQQEPHSVRSTSPATREAPAPAPKADLPTEGDDRAARTVITWGSPVASDSSRAQPVTTARRVGW
ncbi:MAG: SpoIID/LytB domain-containing protein [Rhodothermales bacterium]|nr:SpoIID/LytB domain-containing protein [Rhodothermales bacterium]